MIDIALKVDQTRAEGLLGASEAAAALGLDRYRAPLDLWRKLRGMPADDSRPAFVQEAAEWGQALEPIIRGKYALAMPAFVVVPEESRTKDGWLRCTPDGLVYTTGRLGQTATESECGRDDAPAGLLQVKTCSAYLRHQWQDWIPPAYEIQVRVEMAVTDLPWCDVVCLVGGQQFRGPFRVERDGGIEDKILTDLSKFWEKVQRGIEPEVDGSDAWRRYASDKMRPSAVVMTSDAETDALINAWMVARQTRKTMEATEDQIKNQLLLRLSAAGATKISSACGTVSAYRTGARTDWKKYAISLGGAAKAPDEYKGSPGTWTLRAPSEDDD